MGYPAGPDGRGWATPDTLVAGPVPLEPIQASTLTSEPIGAGLVRLAVQVEPS